VLILGSSYAQGQSQAGPASSLTNTMKEGAQGKSANAREKELLEKRENAVEIQLKNLELDRELIQGQYRNLDVAIKLLQIFLSVITLVIVIAGLFGIKGIRDIQKQVKKDLSEKTQKTIDTAIKSMTETPVHDLREDVNKIDNQLKDLKDAYEKHTGETMPSYVKPENPPSSENIFDENDKS
jgi:hypothetical protein